MPGLIRRLLGRAPDPVDDDTWRHVQARVRWIHALDDTRSQRLRALATLFLQRKTITPIEPLQLDATRRAILAALCCMPLLEFGEEGLHGWSQLIVYPDAFRVNRTHVDAAGVMHDIGSSQSGVCISDQRGLDDGGSQRPPGPGSCGRFPEGDHPEALSEKPNLSGASTAPFTTP